MTYKAKATLRADVIAAIYTNGSSDVDGDDIQDAIVDTIDSVAHTTDIRSEALAANAIFQTLTDGANIDWDVSVGMTAKVTLGGNRTMNAPTNLVEGMTYTLIVVQDGTGSRLLTWNSFFKFAGGTAPTLATAADAANVFRFFAYDNGTNIVLLDASFGASVTPA